MTLLVARARSGQATVDDSRLNVYAMDYEPAKTAEDWMEEVKAMQKTRE